MADKPQIVIEEYDHQERIIEGIKIEPDGSSKRFREKGVTLEEFKKLIRSKLGDSVEIVNRAKKQRDLLVNKKSSETSGKDDRFNSRDIREAMRND